MGGEDRSRTVVAATVSRPRRLSIVGESHYQEALLRICGAGAGEMIERECVAELVPEPDNAHDGNAIRVEIEGALVGYIRSQEARRWQRGIIAMRDAGRSSECAARILCNPEEAGHANAGVVLEPSGELEDLIARS